MFPACGAVARLASLLELATMGVGVARGAAVELESDESYSAARFGDVTLLAGRLPVSTAEGELRLRMIEVPSGLPVRVVVTRRTIRTELSFVLVFVASGTALTQPEIGVQEVLALQAGAFDAGDVGRIMTLGAR